MGEAAETFRQFVVCARPGCEQTFELDPRFPGKKYHSKDCCFRAWYAENSARHIKNTVERAAKRRQTARAKPDPWQFAAPAYDTHMPGGFLEMHSDTPLKWPLEHRNLRGLHGAITALSDEGHDPLMPRFALVPWYRGMGWGVYFMGSDALDRLKGTRHQMRLYEQVLDVRFGGAIRLKAPTVEKRGRRRLRIDTVTPVCTRTERIAHQRASGPNLLSTMCAWLPRRLGLEIGEDAARLEIIENDTRAAHVPMGGKYGTVSGWEGSLVIECNAPAEWLLRAAEVIGLGGQCARGFGRIKVSALDSAQKGSV